MNRVAIMIKDVLHDAATELGGNVQDGIISMLKKHPRWARMASGWKKANLKLDW